jgi:phage terminase Nu1 subunit (DNA packaging protein)
MGRIADQLTELIERMEESDRRLQRLFDDHVDTTKTLLNDLQKAIEED